MLSNNCSVINKETKSFGLYNFFKQEFLNETLEELNLKKIENLENFELNNVKLVDLTTLKLFVEILNKHSVKSLTLYECNFSNENFKLLANFLENSKTIQALNIYNIYNVNNQDDNTDIAAALSDLIKRNISIKTLNISSCGFSETNLKVICEALNFNSSVQDLNLSFNKFYTAESVQALINLVQTNKVIKKLNLSGINIDGRNTINILNALSDNKFIEEIDFSGINFSGINISKALANLITVNKNIKKLFLINSRLTADGLKLFAEALKENTSIEEIDLSNLQLNNLESVNQIVDVIKNNKSIKSLNLSRTSLTPEGLTLIIEALKTNNLIKEISFVINDCSDIKVAQAISDLIKSNKSIKRINLNNTKLSEDGICLIGEALKNNHSIDAIDLSHNDFSKEKSATMLMDLIKENKSIRYLDLRHIIIDFQNEIKFFAEFFKALEKNETIININSEIFFTAQEEYKPFVDAVKNLLERNKQLQANRYMFARMIRNLVEKEQQVTIPNELWVEVLNQTTKNPNEMKYYRERVLQQQNNNNITAQGHNQ